MKTFVLILNLVIAIVGLGMTIGGFSTNDNIAGLIGVLVLIIGALNCAALSDE